MTGEDVLAVAEAPPPATVTWFSAVTAPGSVLTTIPICSIAPTSPSLVVGGSGIGNDGNAGLLVHVTTVAASNSRTLRGDSPGALPVHSHKFSSPRR